MIRTARLAIDSLDPVVVSAFGTTRDGQPLSYNRAPAPDLARWIGRLFVTKIDLGPRQILSCGLFADTAAVRMVLAGEIEADTGEGYRRYGPGLLFCGPHSRRMPVDIHGRLISVGLSLRPSACSALFGPKFRHSIDYVKRANEAVSAELMASLPMDGAPEDWLGVMEDVCRKHIAGLNGAEPEPVSARFEEIAFTDPGMSIAQAARDIGVERRRLERLVSRDFGMPPKQVLKRARALDMASHLLGVADGDEAEALALRYYDESHLIHEFVELFGMTPGQFAATPQPLLTLNLEIRQARRLEMMKRLVPGARRPWQ